MLERVSLDDFNAVPAGLPEENGAAPSRRGHSWHPIDLVSLQLAPAPTPSIAGVAYPGVRHLISGEPETCKTWFALCLAVEEIRRDQSVVYVDFENGPRIMIERLRHLALTEDQIRHQFVYMAPVHPIGVENAMDDLERMLAVVRPSMCVLDSYTGALALHELEPNAGRDIEMFAQLLVNPIRDTGAATVTIDHVTKNKETRGRFSTGSERKLSSTDVHLGLEVVVPFARGRAGRVKIVNHKDRLGHHPPRQKIAELELHSDPATLAITHRIELRTDDDTGGTFRPTYLMERVSRYLEGYPGAEASRHDVLQAVTGKEEYLRQALDVLLLEGFVSERSGARGARLVTSERPFREALDGAVPRPNPDLIPTSSPPNPTSSRPKDRKSVV